MIPLSPMQLRIMIALALLVCVLGWNGIAWSDRAYQRLVRSRRRARVRTIRRVAP